MARVAIIMGVYNGEKYVAKSIESILDQSFEDFELIICDDASTDSTVQILEKYAALDSRIRLIVNEKNHKLAYSLNKCIEMSDSEFVARMDDDDFSHRNRIEIQVKFLEQNPSYALVGTSCTLFDNNGKWGKKLYNGPRSRRDIFKRDTFIHPSVLMRRECIKRVGGYSTNIKYERVEDYELWVRLYAAGYIGYNLPDILLDYYEDLSSYKKRKYKFRINEFVIKCEARKKLHLPLHYFLECFKPLLVGIIPAKIMIKIHLNTYK